MEEATPTFRSKVKRRSRTWVAESMVVNVGVLGNASQSRRRCKGSLGAPVILVVCHEGKSENG